MLSYDMGKRGNASRYDYLYRRIRHDIAHGNILPDEKLPSKRALARNLGVSVITVEAAYAQLIAEGYVRAEERRGYFACELSPVARGGQCGGKRDGQRGGDHLRGIAASDSIPENAIRRPSPASAGLTQFPAASSERRLASPGTSARMAEGVPAFASEGGPATPAPSSESAATALFPYQTWARVMRRTLAEESSATLAQAALGAGSPRLRRAIAAYLREYRGMDVPAERIVVAAGSQTLYQLIIQLLGRERAFAIESPGYPLLERMYDAQGARCTSVPLVAGGIDVAALRESGASVAHVMPAHQFPTGVVMSAAHRRDLLNWSRMDAARAFSSDGPRGRFIIEDDYDAEFRMSGRPIGAARERRCGGARHLFELVHEKPRCGIPHRLYGPPRGPRCAIRAQTGFLLEHGQPTRAACPRPLHRAGALRAACEPPAYPCEAAAGWAGGPRARELPLRRKSRSKGSTGDFTSRCACAKARKTALWGHCRRRACSLPSWGEALLPGRALNRGSRSLRSTARASTSRNLSCRSAARGGVLVCRGLGGMLALRGARGGFLFTVGMRAPFRRSASA